MYSLMRYRHRYSISIDYIYGYRCHALKSGLILVYSSNNLTVLGYVKPLYKSYNTLIFITAKLRNGSISYSIHVYEQLPTTQG